MHPLLLSLLLWFQDSAGASHSSSAPSTAHVPPWLIHLGLPGLCVVSFLDAAIIPLPLPGSGDLLIVLLCAQPGSHPVVIALLAIVTSVLGGYTTWKAGQKGGEAMLNHFVPRRMVKLVNRWMRGHGFVTIAGAAIAPPPVPLMPLLLGAGALGATRIQYVTAFTLARSVRYGFMAWLGAVYGRRVLHAWNGYLSKWGTPILIAFGCLLVIAIAVGVWQYRKQMRSWRAERGREGGGGPADKASAPAKA